MKLLNFFRQAWIYYTLGRLIRQHEISVMRVSQWWSDGAEWSSCDQRMSEDYEYTLDELNSGYSAEIRDKFLRLTSLLPTC
jgi:hypothetical protein